VDVPRDREGSFERIVAQHQRRLAGFDEAVISLYGKGMTTGDIAAHLAEVYDTDVSRDLVSTVTNAVVAEMEGWRAILSTRHVTATGIPPSASSALIACLWFVLPLARRGEREP